MVIVFWCPPLGGGLGGAPCVILINIMSRRWKIAWLFVLVLIIGNVLVWSAAAREDRHGVMTVAFLDIGQGDAIFIEAPNGNQVLVDGGPGQAVLRQLGAVMPWYDRSLDLVLATHPDADHIGGLPEVLRRYTVSNFMEPGVTSDTGVYQELERVVGEQVATKQLTKTLARRGMRIILTRGNRDQGSRTSRDEVYLDVLFPDRDPTGWETNTASIVARLVYDQQSFMLTGDSPVAIERYLMTLDGERLHSTVLKNGHHGSRTSSGPDYLALVNPEYAVISAGKDNRYGHPHAEVIAALEKLKIKILPTSERGNIKFKTDGQKLELI